jgi:hypothetical protein
MRHPNPVTVEALAQLHAAREKLSVMQGEDFGTLVSRMRDRDVFFAG